MKKVSGIWIHVLFWTAYSAVNLFNELYLSSSFTTHPSTELLIDSIKAQILVLTIKIPAVYYVLYSLIPRWSRSPARVKLAIEVVLVFVVMVFCYRAVVQLIIWPLIFGETPAPLTGLQFTARYFYSLMDILQVTGIAAAIKLFRLRLANVANEKLLMQEKLESEMRHLRSQINPHFLFNTLNSIYALARAQSTATPDAVMRLSKILRYMLYEIEKKSITIEEEMKITLDYIELQQIRFGSKVAVVIKKNIDNPAASITPLILLPLLENAFKHGTSERTGQIEILLEINLTHDQLYIKVQNPVGTGMSVKPSSTEGIGLSNIKRRLEMLYSDYNLGYGENGDNFTVEIKINLKSYEGFELLDSRR